MILAILGCGLLENDDQTVEIAFQVGRWEFEAAGGIRWDRRHNSCPGYRHKMALPSEGEQHK